MQCRVESKDRLTMATTITLDEDSDGNVAITKRDMDL